MYLKRIIFENVGPISQIDIRPSFNQDGLPKPLILVGKNGSGKSTVLSNIVDSFYEIAGTCYKNVQKKSSDGLEKDYYKIISRTEIKTGAPYLFSYLEYDTPGLYYLFKAGHLEYSDISSRYSDLQNFSLSGNEDGDFKNTNASEEIVKDAFSNDIVCFFPPHRYEKPSWLGNKYYWENDVVLSLKENWNGILQNPITVENVTHDSLSWLLDLIADSRADIDFNDNGSMQIVHQTVNNLRLLGVSRKNIETIMSSVLNQDVYFALNYRSGGNSRFRIMSAKEESKVVSPTLDSLSTGQLALFNMFATIARYGDANNVNKSIYLNSIKGIVVVDEIELHLHSTLQKEVLPKLIELFPKIQFIITTHSPLFLLGMRDVLGEESFDVFDMPNGDKIDVERFSEFQKAYEYYQRTQTHQEETDQIISQIKSSNDSVPLIITEGSTDWKHMKAAEMALRQDGRYCQLFENLNFKFLEYEPMQTDVETCLVVKMGDGELVKICKNMAKIPQPRKYIFIADRDRKDIRESLGGKDGEYKNWGNNVFSFVIPVPKNRESMPNDICIEHLYSDEEIKTECEIAGKKCRLFMGNEFDERGYSAANKMICPKANSCGPNSIAILEGSQGEKITPLGAPNDNRGLSKANFAKKILKREPPFDHFDFSNFVDIFKIVKDICNQEMV